MLLLAFVGAFSTFSALLTTPLVIRAAARWGWYDVPSDGRRVHTRPIPRLGGVAVFLATAVGLAVSALSWSVLAAQAPPEQMKLVAGILLGGGLLLAAGAYDDIRGLRPAQKIFVQVAAALVVYALGFQVQVLSFGPVTELALGAWSLPLTVVWVVGITNAFNLIDGLDGLATGIALVALLTTFVVAITLGNLEVAVFCIALSGALFGFLRYNFSPARIFLGDSGSLFVGFMLAVLSVHGSMKTTTAALVIVPLFALAIPLLDTGIAIVRRWLRGVPLSGADARHIHHRLLALGLSHRRAALVMYGAAAALAVLGISLAFAPSTVVVAVAVAGGCVTLALLLYGMHHLDYHEFAEAGAVVISGVFRLRRVIQDQIHARDLCQVIPQAASLSELEAILADNAQNFGFVGMSICEEISAERSHSDHEVRCANPRAWKLDYPVVPLGCSDPNPFVLRVWCDPGEGDRPLGALRVARILAPSISTWLVRTGILAPGQLQRGERGVGVGLRHILPSPDSVFPARVRQPGVRRLLSAARRVTAGIGG